MLNYSYPDFTHTARDLTYLEKFEKNGFLYFKQTKEYFTEQMEFHKKSSISGKIKDKFKNFVSNEEKIVLLSQNTFTHYKDFLHTKIKNEFQCGKIKTINKNIYYNEDLVGEIKESVLFEDENPVLFAKYVNPYNDRNCESQTNNFKTFIHAKKILEVSNEQAIDYFFPSLSTSAKKQLNSHIDHLDHIAFMVPNSLEITHLKQDLFEAGFSDRFKVFESQILAKTLGVPTQIIKSFGHTNYATDIGIELFAPQANLEQIKEWIRNGVGSHLAFRAKSFDNLFHIINFLKDQGFEIPASLKNNFMINWNEKIMITYFNLKLEFPFQLEFNFTSKD